MNSGKYVFSQILELVNRYEFEKIVKTHKGNYRVREFSCWNQFIQLFFGQLTNLNSLRDICLCLKAHNNKLYHLGIKNYVSHTTLSRANEKRDWQIFADFGYYLIELVRPLYKNSAVPNLSIENELFALDSTTISCSINLLIWAEGKYTRGAIKVHTLLDLRGSIPSFILITDGKCHDSNVLDQITPEPEAIYIMDKAYVDFKALYRINTFEAYFVTRAKSTLKYKIIEQNFNIDESTGLRADKIIELTIVKSKKLYPERLRLIEYYDIEKDNYLIFMTNNSKEDQEQAYDGTLNKVSEHQVVEGKVIFLDKKEVIVNIGYKSDGIIPASEFRYNPDLKVGDTVEVYIENLEDKKGQLALSHRKARVCTEVGEVIS
jgi:hypothetical protein